MQPETYTLLMWRRRNRLTNDTADNIKNMVLDLSNAVYEKKRHMRWRPSSLEVMYAATVKDEDERDIVIEEPEMGTFQSEKENDCWENKSVRMRERPRP